jgi:tetratricopeptide (TPR) repeat protein
MAAIEYLLAADIFTEKQSYDHAIAIYKQLYRQDPTLDRVYLKIANIYREKGFLADAAAQYRILAKYYESSGMKEERTHEEIPIFPFLKSQWTQRAHR